MISHKHRCIFIHVPRSGGSSIEEAITGYPWNINKIDEKHLSATEAMTKYGKRAWKECFTFSFVRNPWDRLFSMYNATYWCCYNGKKLAKNKLNGTIPTHSCKGFKNFLLNFKPHRHEFKSTVQCDIISLRFLYRKLDFIGRFENLQTDFDKVCDLIGMKRKILPVVEAINHKRYVSYYDTETRGIVAKKYEKDIKYFGYKFGE